MIKRLLKTGISALLAFSLAILPSNIAFSETITDITRYQAVYAASALDLPGTAAINYDEAKTLADKKASVLTSIYGVTSIQYALIDNGNIVLSGQSGVYSKDSKAAITQDNMYGIGSISKMFTTVAVMQLAEQGKVSLDIPVIQYVPEFVMEDQRYKDITVRMLLNHSSGLLGSTFNNAMLFDDNDTIAHDNFLNQLKTQRLKADPGAFSVYCNDGFTLAELLIEKVSGISFSDYIKNNITAPLKLDNTKTPRDDFQKSKLAKTYVSGLKYVLPTEDLNAIGAGGIYSSAQNLCQFAKTFMDNSTSQILKLSSAKLMEKEEYRNGLWPKEEDSALSFGLGWDSVNTYPFNGYGIKALIKGGDTSLFHSTLIVLPEENMAMSVVSSGGSSTYNQIMAQEVLLSVLKAKGTINRIMPDKTFKAPVKASMPGSYKASEGYYAYTGGIVKVDISDDGILTLSGESASGRQIFTYTGDGKFYSADGGTYLSFVEESNGCNYLSCGGYTNIPGIGQIATAGYQAQKIQANQLSEDIKAAWEKRDHKKYFLINEKYSSQAYALSFPCSPITLSKDLEGYCFSMQIIDKNSAKTLIQIPGTYGRDISDITFYNSGNTEYANSNGSLLISENSIKNLSNKSNFTCKINSKGYAHWYKISKNLKNKKIKVSLPAEASFTVYDSNGTCINNSWITKQNTVTLPANGYIVFAGNANATFMVTYIK